MSRREQQINKHKKKRAQRSHQQRKSAELDSRARKYDSLTVDGINRLKQEPVNVILTVFDRHQRHSSIPSKYRTILATHPKRKHLVIPPTGSNWNGSPDAYTGSLSAEAKWAFCRIGASNAELTSMLSLRRQFTTSLILGELDSASTILSTIVRLYGASTWSIEMELLLAEYRGGLEANREMLSQILERPLKSNERLLAEFASQRVDATLSVIHYMRSINNFVDHGNYAATHPSLPFFLQFSLIPQLGQAGHVPPEHAAFYIHSYNGRALIDQYLAILKLLRHTFSNHDAEMVSDLPGHELIRKLPEPELNTLLISGFDFPSRADHVPTIQLAYHFLHTGQLDSLLDLAVKQLPLEPLTFAWYELIAEGLHLTGRPIPTCLPEHSKALELLKAVYTALRFDEDLNTAYSLLLKNAVALEGTPLGYQLFGFCTRIAPPHDTYSSVVNVIYNDHVNPAICAFLPDTVKNRCLEYLDRHHQGTSSLLASQMVRWIHNPALPTSAGLLDSYHDSFFRSQVDSFSGRYDSAILKESPVVSDITQPRLRIAMALRSVFHCNMSIGRYDDAASLVSSTPIEPHAAYHLVDLKAAASAYLRSSEDMDRSLIAWPILLFLDYAFRHSSIDDVFTAYANFMETTGCARPSDFGLSGVERYGYYQFHNFLRYVCDPNVMESDIEFTGTADVENERVKVLQMLQQIDPLRKTDYAAEISQLQQHLAVRKAMRHVAQSKIYFNLEGIEASIDPTYYEQYLRYCAMMRLRESARKSVDLQWDQSAAIGDAITEAPVLLFRSLFHELRYLFLFSNEHGLDSYLSVRIRHQTIKGALRCIFERRGLITEKTAGVYAPNDVGGADLSSLSNEARTSLQSLLASFSAKIDSMIADVSNRLMRIRGAPGGDDGLFFVDFLDEEIAAYQREISESPTFLQFLDFIFSKLRDRLDLCLSSIRQHFKGDLKKTFISVLESLHCDLASLGTGMPPSLFTAITHCHTDVQRGFDELSEWFHLPDVAQVDDFAVQTLVAASIENISKCFPSSPFKCNLDFNGNIRLKGRCFIPLWDALFLVFENVVRYAEECSSETSLKIAEDDKSILFTITNPLGPRQDEATVKQRLETIRNYSPDTIRREEGSGFPKLANLVCNDLQVAEGHVTFNTDLRVFTTRFQLTKSSVIA